MAAQRVRKHFIPLESNPEVFTELIHKLGLPASLCFQDVLSLDDAELLAFLPRPAYATILVFPTKDGYEKGIDEEKDKLGDHGGPKSDDMVFFKQTINNACGLYAILHAACNGEARKMISICLHSPGKPDANEARKRLHLGQTAGHQHLI
jgi:ubiquitin carboxyl-terminal hydrolase L3